MRLSLLFCSLLVTFGCSADRQKGNVVELYPKAGVREGCLSTCANGFAACTEEYPGDFSACARERNSCEATCQAELAEERTEGASERPFEPVVPITQPDAGSSDTGTAVDSENDSGE